MKNRYTLAFIGNPNCGKSTLFNGLTGARQQIGNWPGVTVEKIEGFFQYEEENFRLVDLPGIYSLSPQSEDEVVTRDYLLSGEADLVVNIVDASNLARNLFLTSQLLEMRIPMLVVLNMMDLADKEGLEIDTRHLSAHLKCPVIAVSAIEPGDRKRLKQTITKTLDMPPIPATKIRYPNEIEDALREIGPQVASGAEKMGADPRWLALRVLEDDPVITKILIDEQRLKREFLDAFSDNIEKILGESPDVIIADYLFGHANGVSREVVKRKKPEKSISDLVDSVVVHPFLSVPIFFGVMFLVFAVTIVLGQYFVDLFDAGAGFLFVELPSRGLEAVKAPLWIQLLLADGLGVGLQTVASFIPFIFFMFFMLSLLEDSGYMARAAFVMDRFMNRLGLPGKAFVPMIVGFGCTVPAILATRTLDNRRDKLMTIFMTPMMSCGARLPVYAVFASAFFPQYAGVAVFSLYMAGIAVAVLTGFLLKKTLFNGEPSHLIMELPKYHVPRMKHIFLHTFSRLRDFIVRAGKVILVAVVFLSLLSSISTEGKVAQNAGEDSLLAAVGKAITPIFQPMGITSNNWPATVGLFTGLFAKESIPGTLNALYARSAESPSVVSNRRDGGSGGTDITSGDAETGELEPASFLLLRRQFSPAAAYAYLLFILLYMPCLAALATAMREMGAFYGLLQGFYLTLTAWIFATLFYQLVEGHQLLWILLPLFFSGLIVVFFKLLSRRERN